MLGTRGRMVGRKYAGSSKIYRTPRESATDAP